MQNQPPSLYGYGTTREPSNGNIKTGFVISLIALILSILMVTVYGFIMNPTSITLVKSLKNFYNYYTYIQAFFGLIGAAGFIISLTGTIPAIKQKEGFPHFQAAFGMAFGFVGVLVLIEFVLRLLPIVFK